MRRASRVPVDLPDVLCAAFYEALQHGDIEALMACWADSDDVVCVAPAQNHWSGRAAIREGFAQVLAYGPLQLRFEQVHRASADDTVVDVLLERLDTQGHDGPRTHWQWATHVYLRGPQGWRLLARHSCAAPGEPPASSALPSRQLH